MKITSLETYVVAVPEPYIGGRYWIFVKLKTACGIEGVGEVYAASFHPSVMEAAIGDVYQRYLKTTIRIISSVSSARPIRAASRSVLT